MIEELLGRQMLKQTFEPCNGRFDLGRLGTINLTRILRPVELGEVQTGEKLKANGTGGRADPQLKPFEESLTPGRRDPEHLAGRQFFLFDDLGRNIATIFKSF
jgi:hypothetical protein